MTIRPLIFNAAENYLEIRKYARKHIPRNVREYSNLLFNQLIDASYNYACLRTHSADICAGADVRVIDFSLFYNLQYLLLLSKIGGIFLLVCQPVAIY